MARVEQGVLIRRSLATIIVAAEIAGLFAGRLEAQVQDTPASAANPAPAAEVRDPAASGGGVIGDIVVTANKRSESIQKVPIAIAAVTADRLSDVGVTSTMELGQVVSGLTIQNSLSGTQAHLRGVGTTTTSTGAENAVATYVDNVYIVTLTGSLVQLNNIAQIEVLKGPQGTLFGRNATGGVINIRTRDPQHTPSGDFSIRYGNYDTVIAQGYLAAGLSEKLAADIAGFVSVQGDGWGKNLFNGREVNKLNQYAVRSKWLFEPTDRDEFRLIGDYSRVTGNMPNSLAPLQGTATNYGPGNTTVAERASRVGPDGLPTSDALIYQAAIASGALAPFAVVGEPAVYRGGFYDVDMFTQPRNLFSGGGGSLQWDHHFDDLRFTSITAYRRSLASTHWSNEPIPADRGDAGYRQIDTQFTQELQIGSAPGSAVQWVGGLFYLQARARLPLDLKGSPLVPLEILRLNIDTRTKAGAAFGQITMPVGAAGHITGGLRYSIERREVQGDTTLIFLPAFGGATLVTGVTDAHKTFRKLTWRLAYDHQITAEVLGYVSYNRGFKSGLFNAAPPSTIPVRPEIIDAYEAGLKTDLFDRRLRFNISGFYYDYKDIQVSVFTPISVILDNGAGARIYGVDLDFTAKLGSRLTLTGGGVLMRSKFTSYPDAGFFFPQPLSAGGGTIKEIRSAKGKKLPYAPDFTFNVGANYVAPIGNGEATFNVNYSYSGKFYAGPDNILSQPAYGLLDGSVTYKFGESGFEAGIWGRNLTKKKYHVFLGVQANPGGYELGAAGAPRTYGAMVRYKF
ncbi:MAG TPA: TonB-dependent receptor [Rhizorhapis sp.]|nr:TonB-dependent receptor [Rhizorhapis sp.]